MTRLVQHMSGEGTQWEIFGEEPLCFHSYDRGIPLRLPKSEYREVPPPERWVDVTSSITYSDPENTLLDPKYRGAIEYYSEVGSKLEKVGQIYAGYRLRKVQVQQLPSGKGDVGWAFLVERKES